MLASPEEQELAGAILKLSLREGGSRVVLGNWSKPQFVLDQWLISDSEIGMARRTLQLAQSGLYDILEDIWGLRCAAMGMKVYRWGKNRAGIKIHSVRVGRIPGVFHTLVEVAAQTRGFPGAEWKSFKTREAVEAYLIPSRAAWRSLARMLKAG
jgi:hypothetical protein